MLETLLKVRDATSAARARTKDSGISTTIHRGKFQVVRVTYRASGSSRIEPRTGWLDANETIAFLNSL